MEGFLDQFLAADMSSIDVVLGDSLARLVAFNSGALGRPTACAAWMAEVRAR